MKSTRWRHRHLIDLYEGLIYRGERMSTGILQRKRR